MINEPIEISDFLARKLFVTLTELEQKYGKSIAQVLVEIIYNEETLDIDRIEAIKLVLTVMHNSDLDIEDIENGFKLADVLSFQDKV